MARPAKFDDDDVVLDRAIELLWKDGVGNVSIRDLEVALELRAPSIYRRFHSKDELLVRCIDRYVESEVAGRIRHLLVDDEDPLGGLRRFFTSVLHPRPAEQQPRGCLLTTALGHSAALTPEIRNALDRGLAAIESGFRLQIERAIAIDQIDADTNVEATAKALLMSFQGLLVLTRNGASELSAGIDATFQTLVPGN